MGPDVFSEIPGGRPSSFLRLISGGNRSSRLVGRMRRGQNSPADKSLKRPGREPRYERKGIRSQPWGPSCSLGSSLSISNLQSSTGRAIMGANPGGETLLTASYSGGQATMHSPHFTQSSWSTAFLRSLVVKMASTGQLPTQASQPRAHFSKSM